MDEQEISTCPGVGVGDGENGRKLLKGVQFLFRVMKMFKNGFENQKFKNVQKSTALWIY